MLTAGLAVAWQTLHLRRPVRRSRRIAGASSAFEMRVPGARSRVLVLGDSTGVGVGAGSPSRSLPGLLADEFPDLEIVNACHNGARVADALQQLSPWAEANERFDLVLLFVGGNDVLRLTPWPQLQRDTSLLLQRAAQRGSHTVWLGQRQHWRRAAAEGSAGVVARPAYWQADAPAGAPGPHARRAVHRLLPAAASRHLLAAAIPVLRRGRRASQRGELPPLLRGPQEAGVVALAVGRGLLRGGRPAVNWTGSAMD